MEEQKPQNPTPPVQSQNNSEPSPQPPFQPPADQGAIVVHKYSGIKSKLPWIIIVILLIPILLFAGYFAFKQNKSSPTPIPTPTIAQAEPSPTPQPSASPSGELDQTYTSAEHNFQIDYPSDLNVETKPSDQTIGANGIGGSVYFSKIGPTQKEGTEFYDGITFTIGVVKKDPNDTIKQAADKQTVQADPEVSSRTPLKEITINSLSGYEATVSGLGEFRVIILEFPGKTDRAYYISIFAEGPGESKAQYEKTVSDMLISFRNTN